MSTQHDTYQINLKPIGERFVRITAPLVVSPEEMKRIQGWIGVQLLVKEPEPELTPGERNFGDLIGG